MRLTAADVAAIGITNQRETTFVVGSGDRQTNSHAIVWQDRRTAAFCDSLREAGHTENGPETEPDC